MIKPWPYRDKEDNIDEYEWLCNYVKTNWDKFGGAKGVKSNIISAFKKAFPKIPYKNADTGLRETTDQMDVRYKKLNNRLPKWVDNNKDKLGLTDKGEDMDKNTTTASNIPFLNPFEKKEQKPRKTCGYNVIRKERPELGKQFAGGAHEQHPDDANARKKFINHKYREAYEQNKEEIDVQVQVLNAKVEESASAEKDEDISEQDTISRLHHTVNNFIPNWASRSSAVMLLTYAVMDEDGNLATFIVSSDVEGKASSELEKLISDPKGEFTKGFHKYLCSQFVVADDPENPSSNNPAADNAEPPRSTPDILTPDNTLNGPVPNERSPSLALSLDDGMIGAAAGDRSPSPVNNGEVPPANGPIVPDTIIPPAATPLSEDETRIAITAGLTAAADLIDGHMPTEDEPDALRKSSKGKGSGKGRKKVVTTVSAAKQVDNGGSKSGGAKRGRKRKEPSGGDENVDGPSKRAKVGRDRGAEQEGQAGLGRGQRTKRPTYKTRG